MNDVSVMNCGNGANSTTSVYWGPNDPDSSPSSSIRRRNTLIKTKDEYSPVARCCLAVDTFEEGEVIGPYDILDDDGVAYVLANPDEEVKVEFFEGKQVFTGPLFRIASYPRVHEDDSYMMSCDPIQYAIDASRDAIYQQEDVKFFELLVETQRHYSEWTASQEDVENSFLNYSHSKKGVRNLIAEIKNNFLSPWVIVTNPVNEADLKNWSAYAFLQVRLSPICPEDKSFILPWSSHLGVLPNYGIQVKENNCEEQFYEGRVLSELINMAVLNSRGVGVLDGR